MLSKWHAKILNKGLKIVMKRKENINQLFSNVNTIEDFLNIMKIMIKYILYLADGHLKALS